MRKILIILVITFMWGAFSCKNDDWHFDDFDYTTTYFPYQYPIRTLILGDYMWDNTNDNNHKFIISARVAGMYQNNSNWEVRYQLAPELVSNLAAAENLFDGKTVKSRDTLTILPSQYYTLSPVNQVIVPKGSFVGDIEVQLTEDFFNDPFAVKTKYVLPLSIISSTTDSVLEGRTVIDNPDPRVEADWIITPKNFTIFAIKFINNYHGKYLRRGASVVTDTISSSVIDNIVYRQKYVERDEVCLLQTTGKNRVTVNGLVLRRKTDSSPGKYSMV